MPHNDYAFRNVYGQPNGTVVPTPGVLRQLDLTASQGIDGDNGGTWTPVNPIVIGGAGLQLTNATISGGVTTGPQAAPRALVTATDFPALFIAGSRTRTTVFPLRDFNTRADAISLKNTAQVPYNEGVPGVFQGIGLIGTLYVAAATASRMLMPLPAFRLGPGSWVPTLRMRVGKPGTVAPASIAAGMPGYRFVKIGANGSLTTTNDIVIPTWQATHAYSVGDLVIPTTPNSRQFRCTVAGTSGGAQPAGFPAATVGTLITGDGGVSWMPEVGPAGAASHYITLPLKLRSADYFARGQWQDITIPGNMVSLLPPLNFFGDRVSGFALDVIDGANTDNAYHSLRVTTAVNAFVTQP